MESRIHRRQRATNHIDTAEQLILSGGDYYQVVFTLPSQLSRLALGNRTQLYDLLFSAAWLALKQTIETEQVFDPQQWELEQESQTELTQAE